MEQRWPALRQLSRDLGVLRLRLGGGRLPALVRREGSRSGDAKAPPAPSANLGFRRVRIRECIQETSDAVTLRLESLEGEFPAHRAGQFLTLEVLVGGVPHRRAYSISAAEGDAMQVSVKRIDGGLVSTYLTREAKAGDTLRVLGPSGNFGFQRPPERALILAGGSGITPCISIAETLLRQGAGVRLVYGSRRWDDILFRERLMTLRRRFEGLEIEFFTEEPSSEARLGRLDSATLRAILQGNENSDGSSPDVKNTPAFVCGPSPMMEAAREVLAELGFADVREERFVSARRAASGTTSPSGVVSSEVTEATHRLTILRRGENPVEALSSGTLLETGLAAGVDMPFSCSVGGCAACKVKLVEGSVNHDELSCLSASEKRDGYVLACCAEATSACTIELPAKATR